MPTTSASPKIIHKNGKKLLVLAFTDIDGTINDESIPEHSRHLHIDPGKKAINLLQTSSIPVGLVTARSAGETMRYQHLLNTHGFTICEDGAVILLPDELNSFSIQMSGHKLYSHNSTKVILVSRTDVNSIKKFIQFIEHELKKQDIHVSSTPFFKTGF